MIKMQVRMSHVFKGLLEAGHLEVVSSQNVAQKVNTLLLQLQNDLKIQKTPQ